MSVVVILTSRRAERREFSPSVNPPEGLREGRHYLLDGTSPLWLALWHCFAYGTPSGLLPLTHSKAGRIPTTIWECTTTVSSSGSGTAGET